MAHPIPPIDLGPAQRQGPQLNSARTIKPAPRVIIGLEIAAHQVPWPVGGKRPSAIAGGSVPQSHRLYQRLTNQIIGPPFDRIDIDQRHRLTLPTRLFPEPRNQACLPVPASERHLLFSIVYSSNCFREEGNGRHGRKLRGGGTKKRIAIPAWSTCKNPSDPSKCNQPAETAKQSPFRLALHSPSALHPGGRAERATLSGKRLKRPAYQSSPGTQSPSPVGHCPEPS